MESTLAEILLGCVFERLLQTVESEVQEFLSVLLHSNVRGISTKFFESKAELDWVVLLAISQLQEAEHPQPLVQRVIVNLLASLVNLHVTFLPVICS